MLYMIETLKKIYNGRKVLDLNNLEIEKGRIIGLLGPNGAGKTTLLEILAFIQGPTTGSLWYEDEIVDFGSPSLIDLRQRVVLVQQQPILFSTSVSKNVEFPLKIRKIPKGKRGEIVEELLGLVGMEEFRDSWANRLSGGETQRVAIAQALACSPDVILLDEPTASVDVRNQVTIEGIIRDINREKGISVILTTHDLIQASRVTDQMIFMFEGKVGKSIYENLFSGNVKEGSDGKIRCEIQDGPTIRVETEREGPVRLSINPEAVAISKEQDCCLKENSFRGRLIQLSDEQDRIRVLLDAGIMVSVLIPKDLFGDLDLIIGEDLCLSVPPDSIELF